MYFFILLFLLFPTPLARSHVLAVNFVKDGSLSFTLEEARLAHQADIDHPHCQRHCLPSFHFYSPSPVSIKTHKYQSGYYQLRQELLTLWCATTSPQQKQLFEISLIWTTQCYNNCSELLRYHPGNFWQLTQVMQPTNKHTNKQTIQLKFQEKHYVIWIYRHAR